MVHKKARPSTNVSDKCFRLLRLKHEVQNDARVMKAVVDEVDVLRLCHSLGMAVSDEDNRALMHKFEFGMFDPSKYDTDFARFLREKLAVGIGDSDHKDENLLKIGCLFGKQEGVKAELVQMGFWSRECENGLLLQQQGAYVIEKSDRDEEDHRQFIAFAWMTADLFEPELIRDTPAYVLRFLMSLSSNVSCFLSQEDFLRVESEIDSVSNNTTMQWNSCSVKFRVQRQEEQSDNVCCSKPMKALVPQSTPIKDVKFIGGVFPAVAVESAMPSTTEWIADKTMVPSADFVDWIHEKHLSYALELPRDEIRPEEARDGLLTKFGYFPHEELREVSERFNVQLDMAKQRIRRDVYEKTRKLYEDKVRNADMLFAIKDRTNAAQMQKAQKYTKAWYGI